MFPDPGATVNLSPNLNTLSEAAPTGDPEPLPPVASDIALASDDVLDTEAIPVPDTDSSPASESALSSSALFSLAPSYSAPSTSTPCSSTSSYISAAEMVREAPSTGKHQPPPLHSGKAEELCDFAFFA